MMSDKFVSEGRWVVGTDGSLRAEKAVMWAAKHASERVTPVPLLILHAIPESPIPSREAAAVAQSEGRSYEEMVHDKAERIVGDIAARVRSEYPNLPVETAVVEGHPADLLAEAGKDADQIVVGARGAGAPALVKMLGGTSDYVVAQAQGAIAVVPDQAEDRDGAPVVVGLDDSPQGRLAIARAFQAASLRGVPLIAITAWDYGPYDAFNAEQWEYSIDEMNKMMTKAANELIADKVKEFPDVKVEVRAVRGRPEAALIEASRTAGLVVIGSRGRGGFARLLLGSTSRHVLRESYCPVVVTRAVGGWKDQSGRSLTGKREETQAGS
ncbi:MAG: universal stress protein [Propionibacteriaceae bacterium]|jgi:nucleotide-binding universal stress UspA family protein|nr:universal stress protein [Propionibacteriaceae bacterium]